MPILRSASELPASVTAFEPLPRPRRVLLADPGAFEVSYAINPHMLDEQGALRRVDPVRAREQWDELRACVEGLGLEVHVLSAAPGLPDLVFCANPVLPLPPRNGVPRALRSRMASEQRRNEVPRVADALVELGYELWDLPAELGPLEGTGDGLWHPDRALLWAGVGPRSSAAAWEEVGRRSEVPLVLLELTDPDFYHLDTALAPIDERTCLWFPPAFTPEGRALVRALFADPIEAGEHEARRLFACNAWSPDGVHVLIQRGCEGTNAALRERGLEVVELETGEFLKAGGSVFCMKLALW